MPTIPVHLDLGFALLILGVLFLLAFSPWFRRFALVCVALLIVAAGIFYLKINRENEQAMAQECASIFDPTSRVTIPYPPDVIERCKGWRDEHEAEIEADMAKKCAPPRPIPGLEPIPWGVGEECLEWRTKHRVSMHRSIIST
jgi:hypothetical protein